MFACGVACLACFSKSYNRIAPERLLIAAMAIGEPPDLVPFGWTTSCKQALSLGWKSFARGFDLRIATSVSAMGWHRLIAARYWYQQRYQQISWLEADSGARHRTCHQLSHRFVGCFGRPRTSANDEWCPGAESNHRHCDFQSHALPTELPGRQSPLEVSGQAERGRYKGPPLHCPERRRTHRFRP
jgi:hypothetical protein